MFLQESLDCVKVWREIVQFNLFIIVLLKRFSLILGFVLDVVPKLEFESLKMIELKEYNCVSIYSIENTVCAADDTSTPEKLGDENLLKQVGRLISSSFPPFRLLCHSIHFLPDHLSLFQLPKTRAQMSVDRHSQSLDDVRLLPPPAPLGTVLHPDSSNSYTFGLPHASTNTKLIIDESLYPLSHCQAKSFYGRRSSNCLSLDMLGDEQFLEFIL